MEIIVILAVLVLVWFAWQLARAKRFTRFKRYIETELKPQVVANILADLEKNRSEQCPNGDAHQQATVYYWTECKARILQAALTQEIITEAWLKESGNWRSCQHLFFIEQHKLN